MRQAVSVGCMAAVGVLLNFSAGDSIAQMVHGGDMHQPASQQTSEFQRIEQPLWIKGIVTAGGVGLIGLELWWFLASKPTSRNTATQGGSQDLFD